MKKGLIKLISLALITALLISVNCTVIFAEDEPETEQGEGQVVVTEDDENGSSDVKDGEIAEPDPDDDGDGDGEGEGEGEIVMRSVPMLGAVAGDPADDGNVDGSGESNPGQKLEEEPDFDEDSEEDDGDGEEHEDVPIVIAEPDDDTEESDDDGEEETEQEYNIEKYLTEVSVKLTGYPVVGNSGLTVEGLTVDVPDGNAEIMAPSWQEYSSYKFDWENGYFTEQNGFMTASEFQEFRAGKFYMLWFRIHLEDWDVSPYDEPDHVYPAVFDMENLNVTCDAGDGFEGIMYWQWCGLGQNKAQVLEVAVMFHATEYEVLEGAGSTYTAGQGSEGIRIRFNGDADLFKELRIDGQVVPPEYYQVIKGSTIIILDPAYLDTLSIGSHAVSAIYATESGEVGVDDEIGTTFTIASAEPAPVSPVVYKTPRTGDSSHTVIYAALAVISAAAAAILLRKSGKRE